MIKKCLFPVAGYGTRFLPATKSMPKEMMPIVNKPLVQYGVEEAAEAGMNSIAFVTGRNKRAIEDHFDITYELEDQISGTRKEKYLNSVRVLLDQCTFSYTRQLNMKGLGDAILSGETLIGNNPFGVILADDLCDGEGKGVMSQLLEVYNKYQCCVVAVEDVPKDEVNKYGIVSGDIKDDGLIFINDMVEKPSPEDAPSNTAIIGRYILTPEIFAILRNTEPGSGGEVQITDALMALAKQGKVIGCKFKGRRFDCGDIDGFIEGTNYFYQKRKLAGL